MKTIKSSLALAALALLGACSSTPVAPPAAPAAAPAPAPAPVAKADPRDVKPVAQVDPLNDPNGPLAKRSVYFDFDNYAVKPEFAPVVSAHANYLDHHQRKVVIQGNTDDRGGTEYNLALGQKRAEAVRKALEAQGVPDSQLEAVSFGKEKPKAKGEDEAAWAENRRADLAYQ
ncbi:MAG: peptidoglycan-associated lipoprotein Pal [Telluria sp.]